MEKPSGLGSLSPFESQIAFLISSLPKVFSCQFFCSSDKYLYCMTSNLGIMVVLLPLLGCMPACMASPCYAPVLNCANARPPTQGHAGTNISFSMCMGTAGMGRTMDCATCDMFLARMSLNCKLGAALGWHKGVAKGSYEGWVPSWDNAWGPRCGQHYAFGLSWWLSYGCATTMRYAIVVARNLSSGLSRDQCAWVCVVLVLGKILA